MIEANIGKCAVSDTASRVLATTGSVPLVSDMSELITALGDTMLMHYYNRLIKEKEPTQEAPKCFTREWADLLKLFTWGTELEGVTMPCPEEQTRLIRRTKVSGPTRCTLFTIVPGWNEKQQRGPFRPYFGSTTQLRIKKSTLEILDVDSMITNLKRLLSIQLLLNKTLDVHKSELLTRLIEEKTTVPLPLLKEAMLRVVGGTVSHRVQDDTGPRGSMINQLCHLGTYIKISTDTATTFAKCYHLLPFGKIYIYRKDNIFQSSI